jgi:hypothetical protein
MEEIDTYAKAGWLKASVVFGSQELWQISGWPRRAKLPLLHKASAWRAKGQGASFEPSQGQDPRQPAKPRLINPLVFYSNL